MGLPLAVCFLLCGVAGCTRTQAITVQELSWQTPDGPVRGFVATVALDDSRVEVLVTGPLSQAAAGAVAYPAAAEAVLEPTDAWARRVGADLAVNANFFGWLERDNNADRPGTADIIGLSASDGVIVSPARRYGGGWDDVLLIGRDGAAVITSAFEGIEVYDAVAGVGASDSAPGQDTRLVEAGRNTGATSRVAPGVRHPRTAVGVNRSGTRLILMVVDGRQPGWSVGLTLPELADAMIRHGAWDAINLDGGGSSSFIYHDPEHAAMGQPPTTNRPSDGRFRPVANHLGVRLHPDARRRP